MDSHELRRAWQNTFYRGTICYVATLVTIIFALQVYRIFFDLPSETIQCDSCCSVSSFSPSGQE